jgi:hypothetical protein
VTRIQDGQESTCVTCEANVWYDITDIGWTHEDYEKNADHTAQPAA